MNKSARVSSPAAAGVERKVRIARHKYGAKRVKVDGYMFDSLAEARRYMELKLLLKTGDIADLEVHPKYPLHCRGEVICKVIMDFAYIDARTGAEVIEDVKGVDTDISKLKRKFFEAEYRKKVTLVRKQ